MAEITPNDDFSAESGSVINANNLLRKNQQGGNGSCIAIIVKSRALSKFRTKTWACMGFQPTAALFVKPSVICLGGNSF